MGVYGYVRKDFPFRTIEQLEALWRYDCDEIVIEEHDLKKDQELETLLSKIHINDVLVVASLEVFGKNLKKMATVFNILQAKKIQLISSVDDLDTSETPTFYNVFKIIATTDENCRVQKEQQKTITKSKTKAFIGRPRINGEKISRIQELHRETDKTLREIAKECEVSLGTAHKYINAIASE